jgi:hypothetical protein
LGMPHLQGSPPRRHLEGSPSRSRRRCSRQRPRCGQNRLIYTPKIVSEGDAWLSGITIATQPQNPGFEPKFRHKCWASPAVPAATSKAAADVCCCGNDWSACIFGKYLVSVLAAVMIGPDGSFPAREIPAGCCSQRICLRRICFTTCMRPDERSHQDESILTRYP